jgi:hypothetical protein
MTVDLPGATSLHQHAAICGAAKEKESTAQKELEANALASGDDEVKVTGKPSILINETKYEDESSDSDSASSRNNGDKTNLLPSNGQHTTSVEQSDKSSNSNDDSFSDYQSSGSTDDIDPQYPIKLVLRNDIDTRLTMNPTVYCRPMETPLQE